MISGIYQIRNLVNGKVYVGSSKNILNRWAQHKRDLKRGTHYNDALQRAWNKHGEDGFIFEILEKTSIDELLDREQFWYDKLESHDNNKGYNLSPIARSGSRYANTDMLESGELSFSKNQFDMAVDYLCNTDISIPKVSQIVGIAERTLYQIYFKTEYTELTNGLDFRRRVNRSGRKLTESQVIEIVRDLCNGSSIADAARKFHVGDATVKDIRNKTTWRYLTEDIDFPPLPPQKSSNHKAVDQFTRDMQYVATFESARAAERETGIGFRLISQVCNGEKPSAHGYVFRFAKEAV